MHYFIDTLLYSFLIRLIVADHDVRAGLPPLVEPLENLMDMQTYIDESNKENVGHDSYLFAYKRSKITDNIENKSHVHKRVKRTEPEYIKFELSDAKEPDDMTKKYFHRLREQRKLDLETLKIRPNVKRSDESFYANYPIIQRPDNQVTSKSQSYEIFSPGSGQAMTVEQIPAGVRKAIEGIVLRKRSLYHTQPAKRYASSVDSAQTFNNFAPNYGDLPYNLDSSQFSKSGINLDFASQIPYIPALFPTHNFPSISEPKHTAASLPHTPSPIAQQSPQLKYVHFAKPQIQPPAPKSEEPLPTATLPHNNVNINLPPGEKKIEISFDNLGYDVIKSNIDSVEGPPNEYRSLKKYFIPSKADAMTQALTNLISKTPTQQLKELTELLASTRNPERNRAPILFPPVKADPEDERIGRQKFLSLVPVTDTPRDFTPITEQQLDDVTPEPFRQYLPVKSHIAEFTHTTPTTPILATPTSFKEVKLGPTISYHHDDSKKLQYASKYNFGYRIRDFHTGNDYGHTEKRDNDGVTRGQYHILLPDGRIQNVEYHVDDTGYHADVTYESPH